MSDKNEPENEREIIQIRRVVPKSKPADKSKEDELKAKTAELKRRFFRTRLALGVGFAFFLFLGLRGLGCFQKIASFPPARRTDDSTAAPDSSDSTRNADDDATRRDDPTPFDAPRPSAFSPSEPSSAPETKETSPNVPNHLRVLCVATWNLGDFTFAKLSDSDVGGKIATLIREFDLVAIQGIRAKNRSILDGLVYLIAERGADYSYVATAPSRRDEILAIFFNPNVVDVDRSSVSDVVDSRGRLATPCLVAAFRSASVDEKKCFTFQIIDCDLSKNGRSDGAALVDVYRTLRNQAGALGVSEDDLLLVGDFGVEISKIKELGAVPNFVAIHADRKTDVDGGASANVLFDSVATTEYVERFGVVDLADYFDITTVEAKKIAPGRPVWADFSVYEGGDAQFSETSPSKQPLEIDEKLFFEVFR